MSIAWTPTPRTFTRGSAALAFDAEPSMPLSTRKPVAMSVSLRDGLFLGTTGALEEGLELRSEKNDVLVLHHRYVRVRERRCGSDVELMRLDGLTGEWAPRR